MIFTCSIQAIIYKFLVQMFFLSVNNVLYAKNDHSTTQVVLGENCIAATDSEQQGSIQDLHIDLLPSLCQILDFAEKYILVLKSKLHP